MTQTEAERKAFEGWAILELMGHRRLGGYVTEEEHFGAALLRIDVPREDGEASTQFYSPSALYCLTPTSEEIARAVAKREQPEPVHRWELPQPKTQPSEPDESESDAFDRDGGYRY